MQIEKGPRLAALRLLSDLGEVGGLDLVKASGGELKRGTVYVYLARLADDGLVASRALEDDAGGIPRRLFKLTRRGKRALLGTLAARSAYQLATEAMP